MGDRSTDSIYDVYRQNRQIELGYPTVRVFAKVLTGRYRLNPPDELSLHKEFFAPQLLEAIRVIEDDPRTEGNAGEQRFTNIFRRTGTHYVIEGWIGGVYELWVNRGDCTDGAVNVDIREIGKC